jgi:hypothetical protein
MIRIFLFMIIGCKGMSCYFIKYVINCNKNSFNNEYDGLPNS